MDLITPAAGLLFWMTLIFAVVFFIVAKFGFPVITGMVRRRQDHIAGSLRDAQTAKESLAQIQQTCDKMLDDTRKEQEVLLDKARFEAQEIINQARAQSRVAAEEIINRTARDIELMKQNAVKEMQATTANLVVALTEKILRDNLSDEDAQIKLVERLIDEHRNNL